MDSIYTHDGHTEVILQCNIFMEYLRDNESHGDGPSLRQPSMGSGWMDVLPFLKQYLGTLDAQGDAIHMHLSERLEFPDKTWDQCKSWMPHLSSVTNDPLLRPVDSIPISFRDERVTCLA